jgi:hypothetical protein
MHQLFAGIRVNDIRVAVDTPGDKQVIAAGIDPHPELVTVTSKHVKIGLSRHQNFALPVAQVHLED